MRIIAIAGAAFCTLLWGNPQCYVEGYPGLVASADESAITLTDSTRFPYQNTLPKNSWDETIDHADLATQLSQRYDAGGSVTPPPYLYSPGRLRYQPFFQALYGKDKKEIEKTCRDIASSDKFSEKVRNEALKTINRLNNPKCQ